MRKRGLEGTKGIRRDIMEKLSLIEYHNSNTSLNFNSAPLFSRASQLFTRIFYHSSFTSSHTSSTSSTFLLLYFSPPLLFSLLPCSTPLISSNYLLYTKYLTLTLASLAASVMAALAAAASPPLRAPVTVVNWTSFKDSTKFSKSASMAAELPASPK